MLSLSRLRHGRLFRGVANAAVALCALALLAACEDGNSKTQTEPGTGESDSIPSIDSLQVPDLISAGSTVEIQASISGDPDQDLSWEVSSGTGEGTFSPSKGTVTFDENGEASLTLTYEAPLANGHFVHELVVTDEDDDSGDAGIPLDVRGVGVALFADTGYVDYDPSFTSIAFEASNLQASIESYGFAVTPFTGTTETDFTAAMEGKAVLSIPRLNMDLVVALDANTVDAIVQFVEGGGMLLINDDGTYASGLLNLLFAYGFGSNVPGSLTKSTSLPPDSPFASGPSNLSYHSATYSVNPSSLPGDATIVYESPPSFAGVFYIPEGDGQVFYIGWDWYDAGPVGYNTDGWHDVLRVAVESAEMGTLQ